MTKKKDKPVEDKPVEEKKVTPGKITLLMFKITHNISDIEYAGFKSMLQSKDEDEFEKKFNRKI